MSKIQALKLHHRAQRQPSYLYLQISDPFQSSLQSKLGSILDDSYVWPPPNGFTFCVWFRISENPWTPDNPSDFEYNLLETSSRTSNDIMHSNFKIFVDCNKRIVVSLDYPIGCDNVLDQSQKYVASDLPFITVGTWHHLCCRHYVHSLTEQELGLTLDGHLSTKFRIRFELPSSQATIFRTISSHSDCASSVPSSEQDNKSISVDDTLEDDIDAVDSSIDVPNHTHLSLGIKDEPIYGQVKFDNEAFMEITSLFLLSYVVPDIDTTLLFSLGPSFDGSISGDTLTVNPKYCLEGILRNCFSRHHKHDLNAELVVENINDMNRARSHSRSGTNSISSGRSKSARQLAIYAGQRWPSCFDQASSFHENSLLFSICPKWQLQIPVFQRSVSESNEIKSPSSVMVSSKSSNVWCVVNGGCSRRLLDIRTSAAETADKDISSTVAGDKVGNLCIYIKPYESLEAHVREEHLLWMLKLLQDSGTIDNSCSLAQNLCLMVHSNPQLINTMSISAGYFFNYSLMAVLEKLLARLSHSDLSIAANSLRYIEFGHYLLSMASGSSILTDHDGVNDTWRAVNELYNRGISTLEWFHESNQSTVAPSVVFNFRLLEQLLGSTKLWIGSANELVLMGILKSLRLFIAQPFSRLCGVNKEQLQRANVFPNLVGMLMDPSFPLSLFDEVVNTLEILVIGDYYCIDDLNLIVRSFVGLTLSTSSLPASSNHGTKTGRAASPMSLHSKVQHRPSVNFGESSPGSNTVPIADNATDRQSTGSTSFFGGLIYNKSDTKSKTTSAKVTKASIDSLDFLRSSGERSKIVRRCLAGILVQASSWFSLLQTYYSKKSGNSRIDNLTSSNAKKLVESKPALDIRPGRPFTRKFSSRLLPTSPRTEMKINVHSISLHGDGSDIESDDICYDLEDYDRLSLESQLQESAVKGISYFLTALPLPYLLFLMYQCCEVSVAATEEQAQQGGLLRAVRRKRDPMCGILLAKTFVSLVQQYPGGVRKLQWLRELELYLPALFESLVPFDNLKSLQTKIGLGESSNQIPSQFIQFPAMESVPKYIRAKPNLGSHEQNVFARLDISGMTPIDTGTTKSVAVHSTESASASYNFVCEDIIPAAVNRETFYYRNAAAASSGAEPLISSYLETIFDLLFGGPGRCRNIIHSLLLDWDFSSIEPSYLPAASLMGIEDIGRFLHVKSSALSSYSIESPIMLGVVMEVARVAAEKMTSEAYQLHQLSVKLNAESSQQKNSQLNAGERHHEAVAEACAASRATSATILCSMQSLFVQSIAFRKQLMVPKVSGGSKRFLSTVRQRIFLDDLLLGAVQVFFSAAKAELLAVLLKGSFDSPTSGSGSLVASSVHVSKSPNSDSSNEALRKLKSAIVKSVDEEDDHPVGTQHGEDLDLDLDPTDEEWEALPSDVIYRSCGSTIGRLSLQLISTIAVQRLIDFEHTASTNIGLGVILDSSNEFTGFDTNSAWSMALSAPPISTKVNMPGSISSHISFYLNSAVRRRIVKCLCSWVSRQYDLYVRQGDTSIENPASPSASGKKSKLGSKAPKSLHLVTADLIICASDVVSQMASLELGYSAEIDGTSSRLISSLAILIDLVRSLRDIVMENTLPNMPPAEPVSPAPEAKKETRSWFGGRRTSAGGGASGAASPIPTSTTNNLSSSSSPTPAGSGVGAGSSSPSTPDARRNKTWSLLGSLAAVAGRRTGKDDDLKGRFSARWKEEEMLELCASMIVAILQIRRACVMLIETHHSGHLILSHRTMEFLIENADLLFSKDIFPQHLNFSNSKVSKITISPGISKFFKGDWHKSGYTNHDRYFSAALSCELFSLLLEDDPKTRSLAMNVWALMLNSSLQVTARRLFLLEKLKLEGFESSVDLWSYHGCGFSILQKIVQGPNPTTEAMSAKVSAEIRQSFDAQGSSQLEPLEQGFLTDRELIMTNNSCSTSSTASGEINPLITFYAWFGVLPEPLRNALESNLLRLASIYRERWDELCSKEAAVMDSALRAQLLEDSGESSVLNISHNLSSGLKVGIRGLQLLGSIGQSTLMYELPIIRLQRDRWQQQAAEYSKMTTWLYSYVLKAHSVRRKDARVQYLALKDWIKLTQRLKLRTNIFGKRQWELAQSAVSTLLPAMLCSTLTYPFDNIPTSTWSDVELILKSNLCSSPRDCSPMFLTNLARQHALEREKSITAYQWPCNPMRYPPWFRTRLGLASLRALPPAMLSHQISKDSSKNFICGACRANIPTTHMLNFCTCSFDSYSMLGIQLESDLVLAAPEAEQGLLGSTEPGTDGTVMAVAAFKFRERKGEWTLCCKEGPSRMRRKIRRGNLALLRVLDKIEEKVVARPKVMATPAESPKELTEQSPFLLEHSLVASFSSTSSSFADSISHFETPTSQNIWTPGNVSEASPLFTEHVSYSPEHFNPMLNDSPAGRTSTHVRDFMNGSESPDRDSFSIDGFNVVQSTGASEIFLIESIAELGIEDINDPDYLHRNSTTAVASEQFVLVDEPVGPDAVPNESSGATRSRKLSTDSGYSLGEDSLSMGEYLDEDDLIVDDEIEARSGSEPFDDDRSDVSDNVDENIDDSRSGNNSRDVMFALDDFIINRDSTTTNIEPGILSNSEEGFEIFTVDKHITDQSKPGGGVMQAEPDLSDRGHDRKAVSITTPGHSTTPKPTRRSSVVRHHVDALRSPISKECATNVDICGSDLLAMEFLHPGESLLETQKCEELLGMESSPRWCFFTADAIYLVADILKDFASETDGISALSTGGKALHTIADGSVEVWLPRNSARARAALRNASSVASNSFNSVANAKFVTENQSLEENIYRRWNYEQLTAIYRRCFLQVDRALEIIISIDFSVMLIFPTTNHREVFISKLAGRVPTSSSAHLQGWKPQRLHGPTNSLLKINDSTTERWSKGQISNFDYLMYLNMKAGRSFSDWTCYPIFPWVLQDYHSNVLDLDDPSVYRDLSRPMGALSTIRERAARDRYNTLLDLSPLGLRYAGKNAKKSASRLFMGVLGGGRTRTNSGTLIGEGSDDPSPIGPSEDDEGVCKSAYHFGTHYSSSAVVLHYLVRLQPFSSHCIALQGGRFDRPDRLFTSVRESWLSASGGISPDSSTLTSNLQDVKELIPEFYYLPDFLSNINGYEMGFAAIRNEIKGRCQGSGAEIDESLGLRVGDVELPPWANGSAREFIRLHRAALESDYVSAHLHLWIDLIFGYKQCGPAAEKACNLFHFLTYPGAVNIDKVTSPVSRHAYEQQIRDFGQTPQQLFTSAHPMRRVRPVNIVDGGEEALLKRQLQLKKSLQVSDIRLGDAGSSLGVPMSCLESQVEAPCSSSTSAALRVVESETPALQATGDELSSNLLVACTTGLVPVDRTSSPAASRHKRAISDPPLGTHTPEAPALVETMGSVPVSSAKLNLNLLSVTGDAVHVSVVALSDMLLQGCGIRPSLNRPIPNPDKPSNAYFRSHRSIQTISAKHQYEGATNINCIRITSAFEAETILATGFLDSTLKCISAVDGDWKVTVSINSEENSLSSSATISDDGSLLLVALFPSATLQLWKRSQILASAATGNLARSKPSVSFSNEDNRKSESTVEHSEVDLDNAIRERNSRFPYDLFNVFSAFQFHPSGCINVLKMSIRHGIFVTACADGIVILWDFETFSGMHLVSVDAEFNNALGEVFCVDIDEVNGDIYIAVGGFVQVFDINGRHRLTVNIAAQRSDNVKTNPHSLDSTAVPSAQNSLALCVQACPIVEWAPYRGFVVGCSDGSILMWSFGHRRSNAIPKETVYGSGSQDRSSLSSRDSASFERQSSTSTSSDGGGLTASVLDTSGSYCCSSEGLLAQEVFSIEDAFGSAGVSAVCLANDMKCIFAGSEEGTIAKWNLTYQLI